MLRATVAQAKSKRRSRKRRTTGAAPRAVPAKRREPVAAHRREQPVRAAANPLSAYGERPRSPFGGLPVSEVAIFAGAVGVVVGLIEGGGAPLIVGVIVCALGVIEVTAREHFSGYRSHALLLAGVPAVGVEMAIVLFLGEPRTRALLLVAVIPVYALLFVLLRKRFQVARQARIARPPAPH